MFKHICLFHSTFLKGMQLYIRLSQRPLRKWTHAECYGDLLIKNFFVFCSVLALLVELSDSRKNSDVEELT